MLPSPDQKLDPLPSPSPKEQSKARNMCSSKLGFFLVLFFFIADPLFGEAQPVAAPEPVRDVSGQSLTVGANYFILPAPGNGTGGGIGLSEGHNETCSYFVAQEQTAGSNGLPVTFTPFSKTNDSTITVSADLNVQFTGNPTNCGSNSTLWKLGFIQKTTGNILLTVGGTQNQEPCLTSFNWFKIVKQEGGSYKLVFCPDVCMFSRILCKDVGIFVEDGRRFLGLTDSTTFGVVFKRA